MFLQIIKSEGLAHNSYFLSQGDEAIVVDPRRDCSIYLQLAKQNCVKIKYILETHRNEDYVIGSLDLQNLTDAKIAHSTETPFKYGEYNLSDGDILNFGNYIIKTLYTPGHTNDSLCYVIYEHTENEPMIVFTGDTLFIGDVGRTDLPGLNIWRIQTEKLHDSLHQKILPLGDHVLVYPSHGAGSICGHNISERDFSTIGYEKKTNSLLKLDRNSFIEYILSLKLLRPPYFIKMEDYNLNGPPLLKNVAEPKSLTLDDFDGYMDQPNVQIVDTREPGAFVSSHIPGSLNIWLDGLSFYPGWTLKYDQRILLITEEKDSEKAIVYLYRLGFDNILGYLCPSIKEWRTQGKPITHLGALSPPLLKEKLAQNDIILVDVREESEWDEGHIEGAKNIYVGHLTEAAKNLPHDKPIATICAWGGRGGIGASILKKQGFKEVYNVLGGMNAWKNLGYPTK
jgi:hydroxyacylglutathione hydrolase